MTVSFADRVNLGGARRSADELLLLVESYRNEASKGLDRQHKAAFGQFFTPLTVARQLASMFVSPRSDVRLLDPGAGVGSLLCALIVRFCEEQSPPASISVVACEIDPLLHRFLEQTLRACEALCADRGVAFSWRLLHGDFLEHAAKEAQRNLFAESELPTFTHVIMNPPYRKIAARSTQRLLVQQLGVEVTNLYSGFVTAAIQVLDAGGELVAITPRSFCNGPYFKQFRKYLLRHLAIDQVTCYESRQALFRDDAVLQENISFHAVKSSVKPQTITFTADSGKEQIASTTEVPYAQVVRKNDPEMFIRLAVNSFESADEFVGTLHDLGLSVSTGRVVDFRAREFLRDEPGDDTVPLLYPLHFASGKIVWPRLNVKKANAIVRNEKTAPLLVPNGHYVLIRRLSAKEEKRRVVAVVYDATAIDTPYIGFENHLNYIHESGKGMGFELARGLAAYLNSTYVDTIFREFNGHT